ILKEHRDTNIRPHRVCRSEITESMEIRPLEKKSHGHPKFSDMEIPARIAIGLVVGTLIGMTGLGGGVLLLPVLIFGLKVSPMLAVGSDAAFNFITKIGSGWMHLRKGTVRRKVVMALATGSIPGSIVGVGFLAHLRHVYGS